MKTILTMTVFALANGIAIAQNVWEATSFTYDQTSSQASYSRRVFASPNDSTIITAYSVNAAPTNSYISNDGGATWNPVLTGKPIHNALFLPDGNILLPTVKKYLTTQIYVPDSLYHSNDGISWTNLGEYDCEADNKESYAVSDNNKIFFPQSHPINGHFLDISSDNGISWSPSAFYSGNHNAMSVSSSGDTIIISGTGDVKYSHDGGNSWNNSANGGWGTVELGASSILPNGDIYLSAPGKIYKSTDGGQNFIGLSPDPWMAITGISHFTYHKPSGKFFMKNGSHGIFESTDCITWTNITNNLNLNNGVTDLAYSKDYIYASFSYVDDTLYRYKIEPSTTVGFENISNQKPFSISPNPANETVTINNMSSGSTIRIIDMYGKVVYSTELAPEQLQLNVSTYVNGIYNVQIENNGKIANRKLIINR